MLSFRICKFCKKSYDLSCVGSKRFYPRQKPQLSRVPVYDVHRANEEEEPVSEPAQEGTYMDLEAIKKEAEETPIKKNKIPIITCMRSRLNMYKGDTFEKGKPIPMASRGWHHRESNGDYFTIHPYENYIESDYEEIAAGVTFDDFNLNEQILSNLAEDEIRHASHIQKKAIPLLLAGTNAILTADTGSGKTLAFLIPIMQQILKWKKLVERRANHPLVVIVTPSKELTTQIGKVAKNYAKGTGINTVVLTGGHTVININNPPVNDVDLLVSTIGIVNKLSAIGIYKLDFVRHVVVDEADTLFDLSFCDKLRSFLKKIEFNKHNNQSDFFPVAAQLTLTSATMPENVPDTLNAILPVESFEEISTENTHRVNVPQKFLRLIPSLKPMTLLKFVKKKSKNRNPVIIFSNTNKTSDFVNIFLQKLNVNCVNLNKNMKDEYRRKAFSDFQSGKVNVLSTTDAAARGLDTTAVRDVINYDFPLLSAEYIHRCGRIGRLGSPKGCKVINFISGPLEVIMVKKIEFATRKLKPIPIVDLLHLHENEEINDEFKPIQKRNKRRLFMKTDPRDTFEDEDDNDFDTDEDENVNFPT